MKPNRTIDPEELRRRAEDRLQTMRAGDTPPSSDETQRLLQDLEIHQIELELQNEELRRAYVELEKSQARYFDLYDQAPVGYATVSPEGLIVEANLAAVAMLGMVQGALPVLAFSRFVSRDDLALYNFHRNQLFTTAEMQTCELRIVKADKTTCWVQLVMSVAPGSRECRLVFNDITARKRAEELQDVNVELQQKVEQRTRELLQAEKLAAIGKLSAGIAHELNNPLQSITTILKGIGTFSKLPEKDAVFIDMALKECWRMRNLIASLRDFYRPSTGEFASVDLHALLDYLLQLVPKLLARKISVVKEYAADLPAVRAVADQLQQVFLNLLNNAIDACEGGGTITITTEVVGGDNVVVHVRDTGAGIDPAHISKIFDPFFTTKPQNKGTGLGLSVSHGIIKDHGGRIDVKSEQGSGTVFSVFLPANNKERM